MTTDNADNADTATQADASGRVDVVEKCGEKWCVRSKAGELLGEHETEEEALAQLAAVEASDSQDPSPAISTPLTADLLTEQMADSGRVFRLARMSLHLDERQLQAIDLAISVAEANGGQADEATMRAVGDAFRRDGFDDQLTDEGFWRGTVLAARTGTQPYSNGVTTWREYRSADEVGSADSLASWALKAFTDDHPPVLVTPANYRDYAVGSIGQDAALTEPANDGQQYVKVTILVGDLDVLRKIREGKVELSAGYTVIPVDDAGSDPVDGEAYTVRQTKIRINHLSLVDAGRAGPLARIELDGSAWELLQLPQSHGDTMTTDKKDQLDPEVSEPLLAALGAYMHPESPEAAEAALQSLASMMSLDPEVIQAVLMPPAEPESMPEAEADPAAESPTLMDVTIADGVVAKMTEDARAKWETIMTEKTKADEQRTTTDSQIAAQAAELAAQKRHIDRLTADADRNDRRHLIDSVASRCPDLVAAWRKIGDDAKIVAACKPLTLNVDGKEVAEAPMATLQRAIVCDLDAGAAGDFEAAMSRHARTWSDHVQSSFDTTMRVFSSSRPSETPKNDSTTTLDYNQALRLHHVGQTG